MAKKTTWWYVQYEEQYPIYEPAEGGYYYAGSVVETLKKFHKWNEACSYFEQLRKEFIEFNGIDPDTSDIWYEYDYSCNGERAKICRIGSSYIGRDKNLYLTNKPRKSVGQHPYE